MKKASVITMIVGLAVSVISIVVSLIFASPDWSTLNELLHSCCYGLFYSLFFLGIAAITTGALGCAFSADIEENCTLKTGKLSFASLPFSRVALTVYTRYSSASFLPEPARCVIR